LNIVSVFLAQAQYQPAAPAVCAPGTHFNVVSYGRLEMMSKCIARHAAAAGLRRGTVAILAGDPIFHLALYLGLARIGVVKSQVRLILFPMGQFTVVTLLRYSTACMGLAVQSTLDKGFG
jgi:acyl-CoA synthetase (AMP-forming)/AMP-acid ligase II